MEREAMIAAVASAGEMARVEVGSLGAHAPLPLKEAHLQGAFVDALRATIESTSNPTLVVKPNKSILLANWPGVGPVDVAVLNENTDPEAFVELKCGLATLHNCVWDVAKMDTAHAEEKAQVTLLAAAAPASEWPRAAGAEFFETLVWATWTDVLVRYRKLWGFWKKDVKTHPKMLPKIIRTTGVGAEPLLIHGERWEFRVVSVSADSPDWVDVESGMTLERWEDHFTSQEGDFEILSREQVAEILGGEENIGKLPRYEA